VTIRIAMWSGPRNISTAMMRAWENRPDCAVIDEPFYACYLTESGAQHPCREAVLASQPTRREQVVAGLLGDMPAPIYYQKHMTHHMPEGCDMGWVRGLRHAFLIRDPAAVIASYLKKMPSVCADDIGITRQWQLFQEIAEITGTTPPVIDSAAVLGDPAGVLEKLCDALEVDYSGDAMTCWPAGPRASDGVWADHWYASVRASTGFAPPGPDAVSLEGEAADLADQMAPYYQSLRQHQL